MDYINHFAALVEIKSHILVTFRTYVRKNSVHLYKKKSHYTHCTEQI